MIWPLVKLSEVVGIHIGKTPSRNNLEYWGDGKQWLSIRDMNQGKVLEKTAETITSKAIDETNIYLSKKGTVLFSFKLSIGKVGIAANDLYHNEAIASLPILDRSRLCEEYLYFALQQIDVVQNTDRAVMGATLNKKKLAELKIPLPPLETQKKIAAVLEKADQLRKDCKQMEQELNNLAQSVFIDMFGDPVTNSKGWEKRLLSDFYINDKDGTKCGPFGSALKKEEYVQEGIPVWNMDNITLTGEFIDSPKLWITKEKFNQLEAYKTIKNDVIISRAGTVGKMGVVTSQFESSIISTNLIRVRFDEEKLLPKYFIDLMRFCGDRLPRLKKGADGSFTHMNTGILDKLEFPYPPIDKQLRYQQVINSLSKQKEKLGFNEMEVNAVFNSIMQKAFKGELNLKAA